MERVRRDLDLNKNGFGDMVVSVEHFEDLVYFKLQEADREAELTNERYSPQDVLNALMEESMKNF